MTNVVGNIRTSRRNTFCTNFEAKALRKNINAECKLDLVKKRICKEGKVFERSQNHVVRDLKRADEKRKHRLGVRNYSKSAPLKRVPLTKSVVAELDDRDSMACEKCKFIQEWIRSYDNQHDSNRQVDYVDESDLQMCMFFSESDMDKFLDLAEEQREREQNITIAYFNTGANRDLTGEGFSEIKERSAGYTNLPTIVITNEQANRDTHGRNTIASGRMEAATGHSNRTVPALRDIRYHGFEFAKDKGVHIRPDSPYSVTVSSNVRIRPQSSPSSFSNRYINLNELKFRDRIDSLCIESADRSKTLTHPVYIKSLSPIEDSSEKETHMMQYALQQLHLNSSQAS